MGAWIVRAWVAAAVVATAGVAAPSASARVDWSGRTLPHGVSRTRLVVDGLHTRLFQAGPRRAHEAIVYVHGNPGSGLDAVRLLQDAGGLGRRAIAIDMPGFGRASKPDNFPYTPQGEAAFLAHVLAKLNISRVHLALHDFGGPFGLEWAIRHPAQLKSIVLIDTGVFLNYYGHPLALAWHTPVVGEIAMAAVTKPTFTLEMQSGNPRLLPQDFVDRSWSEFDAATRRAALKLYRSISNPDAMGRAEAAVLRKKRRPALVIWGATDQYIPAYVAYEQNQAFPGARVELLDSGHWPFVDNVAKVDRLVIPFWRKNVPRPAPRRRTFSRTRGAAL